MKKLLVDKLRETHELSEAEAGRQVDAVFGALEKVLNEGERVSIQGFGTFERKYRDTRTGRNPATGEAVTIQGRHTIKFREARQRKR